MAVGRTSERETQRTAPPSPAEVDERVGFGSEFRELARQRRFVREAEEAPAPRQTSWRAQAAAPRAAAAPAAQAPAPAQPTPAPKVRVAAAATPPAAAPTTAARTARTSTRISDDQRAVLLELSKMSDRLVQSREELATMTARAARAEADVAAANQRVMAARMLVQDAQRATHQSAERCAWLEGRCETLQEALDLAVNASVLTRWRWRREQRARG